MPLLDIDSLILQHGKHKSFEEGACLMEMVAYVAGEPHSDHPECASRVLTDFGIRINDQMNEAERQQLKPFIPRLIGTYDPTKEKLHAHILCWSAIVELTPTMLHLVEDDRCDAFAKRLEQLSRYDWASGETICNEARIVVRKIRDDQ